MAVIPKNAEGKKMFIACETNPQALKNNEPPFLCIYQVYLGGGHANFGDSDDWRDMEKFITKAKAIIFDQLDESEVTTETKSKKGINWKKWVFWK